MSLRQMRSSDNGNSAAVKSRKLLDVERIIIAIIALILGYGGNATLNFLGGASKYDVEKVRVESEFIKKDLNNYKISIERETILARQMIDSRLKRMESDIKEIKESVNILTQRR